MYYIRYNGKQILIECGLYQCNDYLEGYKINSEKFKFNPNELDYVFIGHCHVDHIGLVPRLIKEGFEGKIIASHETAQLMKPLLLNSCFLLENEAFCLSKKYGREYSSLYSEDDVNKTLSLIYEYNDIHREYILDDVVSFKWYENSHCIGSRQLVLGLKDTQGVKHSILYTSDIGSLNTDNHYVPNTEIVSEPICIALGESTYGEIKRCSIKTRKQDLEHFRVAIDTCLERGGTVLLPAFSFSRSQELLTNLYNLYYGKDVNIYVDSLLTCDICGLYDKLIDDELWEKVRAWDRVKYIKEKSDSLECVKDRTPKIVISSSGFCTNGRILSYLHAYLSDTNSMVIFTGFTGTDPSYLSYRIKNYKDYKELKISGDVVKNRADCISLNSFSSHASRNDLIKYYSNLNTNKLILVHGSENAKNDLKHDLINAISKNDKTYKVVSAVKDMYIKIK